MKKMKKIGRWLMISALSLVMVVVVLLASHPLWLGPVATAVANKFIPGVVGTRFSVGRIDLNAFRGTLSVRDFYLANPPNYSERDAVKFSSFDLSVDVGSLRGDIVHIRNVDVKDLFVSYVKEDGASNFQDIAAGFSSPGPADADPSGDTLEPDEKCDKESPKVIIDRVSISGVKVKYGNFLLPIPFQEVLSDIGKKSNGVNPAEALMEIGNQLLAMALKAGSSVRDAVSLFEDSFKSSFKSLKKEFKKATE